MPSESFQELLQLGVEAGRRVGLSAQKEHILGGLHRIFSARLGGWAELRGGARLQSIEIGCADRVEREQLWASWVSGDALFIQPVQTWTRKGLLFSEYRSGRDDDPSHALLLQREAPFSHKECQLVDAFHRGCREIYQAGAGRSDSPAGALPPGALPPGALPPGALPPGMDRLPARYHPTLELLLRGSSEKEVAVERNLSIHTVHEYVKKIYEHFGVSSRPKLLALWIEKKAPPPQALRWSSYGSSAEGG